MAEIQKRLDELCQSITDCPHSTPKWTSSGNIVIRNNNIKNGRLDLSNPSFTDDVDFNKRIQRATPESGDIIITREAPMGEVCRIPTGLKCCLGQRMVLLKPNYDLVDGDYLLFVLMSRGVQTQIMWSEGTGSTVSNLRIPHLCALSIPYLPIEKQRAIGRLLASLDEKIEINKQINDNLYQIVSANYSAHFGKLDMEKSTIGSYAERIFSGGTPSTTTPAYWNGRFPWFSSGETRNRFVISTEKSITQSGIENSSTKLASKYDIVMASAGQGFTRGQTSLLLLESYVNQSVIVIHASKEVLPFLFWNLSSRYEELRAISDSSSIRGSLTTKMIASFEIPKVDSASLLAFSEITWPIIHQIEKNLMENQRLSELRDSILPRLLSGEINVSNVPI